MAAPKKKDNGKIGNKQGNEELWKFTPATPSVLTPPASTATPSDPISTSTNTTNRLSWGSVYKTVGDVPEEGISYGLPRADYRNACYMWQVPNYEVVVPGEPSYRIPFNHAMLSAFGFLDSDKFEDTGMISVSSCSNWREYVKQRQEGNWNALLQKLQNNEGSSVNSTGIAPAGTTVSSWDSLASIEFKWILSADAINLIPMPNEQTGTDFINDIKTNGQTYLSTMAPAIPENYLASTDFSAPENLLVRVFMGTCNLTSGFDDIPILTKLPFSVVQSMAKGTYTGTTDFDFQNGVFTGSVSINGTTISPSNFHLQIELVSATLK